MFTHILHTYTHHILKSYHFPTALICLSLFLINLQQLVNFHLERGGVTQEDGSFSSKKGFCTPPLSTLKDNCDSGCLQESLTH